MGERFRLRAYDLELAPLPQAPRTDLWPFRIIWAHLGNTLGGLASELVNLARTRVPRRPTIEKLASPRDPSRFAFGL